MSDFGDFIRGQRLAQDLSLREAARRLDISASYLSRLESGDMKPPSGEILHRMAALYKLNHAELLDQVDDRGHEFMAADKDAAPLLQALYRLSHGQTPEAQRKMLEAAVATLDLPAAKKAEVLENLLDVMLRSNAEELPRLSGGSEALFALEITPRTLSRLQIRKMAKLVLAEVFGRKVPVQVPVEKVVEEYDPEIRFRVSEDLEGGRLSDGSPAVLGLSRWCAGGEFRELILHEDLFEAEDDVTRRRGNFTLAHEHFHCIEHLMLVKHHNSRGTMYRSAGRAISERTGRTWGSGPRRLHTSEDWREWQANCFAAELLMPAEMVEAAVAELFGVSRLSAETPDVARCAKRLACEPVTDSFGHFTSLNEHFDVNPQAMAYRLTDLGLIESQQ